MDKEKKWIYYSRGGSNNVATSWRSHKKPPPFNISKGGRENWMPWQERNQKDMKWTKEHVNNSTWRVFGSVSSPNRKFPVVSGQNKPNMTTMHKMEASILGKSAAVGIEPSDLGQSILAPDIGLSKIKNGFELEHLSSIFPVYWIGLSESIVVDENLIPCYLS